MPSTGAEVASSFISGNKKGRGDPALCQQATWTITGHRVTDPNNIIRLRENVQYARYQYQAQYYD